MGSPKIEEILNLANNRRYFNELCGIYDSGLVLPYIGAGLSVFARKYHDDKFYTWREFLDIYYQQCFGRALDCKADLYNIADEVFDKEGEEQFYARIQACYGALLNEDDWNNILDSANNEAIGLIPKLFNGPIITTNFDRILEKLYHSSIKVFLPNDKNISQKVDDVKKHRVPSIYKIHGCVSDKSSIIFTGTSYERAYKENSIIVTTLSQLFSGFSFLFIGSSLQMSEQGMDRSIKLWTQLKEVGMYHYAILEEPDNIAQREDELVKQNIYPIFYPKGQHDCIKIILEELYEQRIKQIGEIPRYKSTFIPRKYITEQIKTYFEKDTQISSNSVLVIHGYGGVGKTRIMQNYALSKLGQSEYKYIIWLNAISQAILMSDIYYYLVNNRLLKEGVEKTDEEIINIFTDRISNDDSLILLDNVEDFNDVKNILSITSSKNYSTNLHFIITSRTNIYHSFKSVDVSDFTLHEAQQYLFTYTGKIANRLSEEIAYKLGCHPLAIEQAAAYIKNNNISYKDYLELLADEQSDILNEGTAESRTLYVNATWNISMRMIDNKSSKALLNICSYFAPNNIQFSWVEKYIEQLDINSPLYEYFNNNTKFDEIVLELDKYSLIRRNSDNMSFHGLMQTAVRKSCKNDKTEWDNFAIDLLYQYIFPNEKNTFSRDDFRMLLPHIDTLLKYSAKDSKKASRLSHFIVYGLEKLNMYHSSLQYERDAIERQEFAYGTHCEEVARTKNLLGVIYTNIGDYTKAKSYLEEALLIREDVLDVDDILIAHTHNNLGILFYHMELYADSERHHKLALDIKNKIKDDKIRAVEISCTQNNIGALYDKMARMYNNKALDIHCQALDNRKEDSKENIAFTLHNIGVIFKNLGNYTEALSYFKQALKIRDIIYRDDESANPHIGQTCLNIANIYMDQEKYYEAFEFLNRAKIGYLKTYSEEHHYASDIFFSFGKYYYCMGKYTDALEYFQRALNIRQNKLHIPQSSLTEIIQMIDKCKNG